MPPKKAAAAAAESKPPHMTIKTRVATEYESPTSKKRKTRKYRASAKPEKSVESAIEFFRRRIIVNEYLLESPDGPYTWILKQMPDESLMFAAGRTVSRQELGTLHKNLDAFTPPAPVLAAGELAKADDSIAFNLLSGSYMETAFKRIKDDAERKRRQEEILQIVADHLRSLGFEDVAFLEAPEGTDPKKALGGAPILDAAEIITRLSEIAEYDKLLSRSHSSSSPAVMAAGAKDDAGDSN
jgi:hypothetical protein